MALDLKEAVTQSEEEEQSRQYSQDGAVEAKQAQELQKSCR